MKTMPRIHIDKQDAQIGIKTTNARLKLVSRRLQMRATKAEAEMQTEQKQPAFKVDWQRVRAESGLPGPIAKSAQLAGEAQQQALGYTCQEVQDGNYLAKTELGGNRVAQLEKERNFDSIKEVNLGTMPQGLPNIQWEPGFIHITWSNTQLQVEWDHDYMPTFSVEPHSVEIFLRNKPYIRITVSEDPLVGLAIVDAHV